MALIVWAISATEGSSARAGAETTMVARPRMAEVDRMAGDVILFGKLIVRCSFVR